MEFFGTQKGEGGSGPPGPPSGSAYADRSSKKICIALYIVYRNNKYMIQLLVSINVAYITITRPVIKDRPRSLLYRPNSQPHRPRSLAEFTKTGRDHERPRSPATDET